MQRDVAIRIHILHNTHFNRVPQLDQFVDQLVEARRSIVLVRFEGHLRVVALRIVARRHDGLRVLAHRVARPAVLVLLHVVVFVADSEIWWRSEYNRQTEGKWFPNDDFPPLSLTFSGRFGRPHRKRLNFNGTGCFVCLWHFWLFMMWILCVFLLCLCVLSFVTLKSLQTHHKRNVWLIFSLSIYYPFYDNMRAIVFAKTRPANRVNWNICVDHDRLGTLNCNFTIGAKA